MDVWLLLCILYVVMQLLEYTVILYILLTDDKNVLESEKKEKLMMCRKIDSWARKFFFALDILMLVAYYYVTLVNA